MVDNGIKIVIPNPPACTGADLYCNNQAGVKISSAASNLTLKYLEVSGPAGATPFTYTGDLRGIDTTVEGATENLLISHCSIHGFVNGIYIGQLRNSVIEYTKIYDVTAANSAMFLRMC